MKLKKTLPVMALIMSMTIPETDIQAKIVIPQSSETFTILEEAPPAFDTTPVDTNLIERKNEQAEKELREEQLKQKLKKDKKTIWASTLLNIRTRPTIKSKVIGSFVEYEPIKQLEILENGWIRIKYNGEDAYINSKYTTSKSPTYTKMDVPSERDRGLAKSHMSWTAVTDTSSPQYKLLHSDGMGTGKYGIKTYNGRLCVAMGSYYSSKIGTKFDITLDNGTKLYCVLADQKSDDDTNETNQYHECDGSIIEFVVETSLMPTQSYSRYKELDSKIQSIVKVD